MDLFFSLQNLKPLYPYSNILSTILIILRSALKVEAAGRNVSIHVPRYTASHSVAQTSPDNTEKMLIVIYWHSTEIYWLSEICKLLPKGLENVST